MQTPTVGWPSLFELLQRFGVIVFMVIIMIAGWRRMWVWGWHYDELEKDRDMWRTMALKDKRE